MTQPNLRSSIDWLHIASLPEFRELMRAKRRFIVPATIFFVLYYFSLPILVGYAPAFMARRVFGPVNLAYLFALSQFFMAWILAWLYMRVAETWDRRQAEILTQLDAPREERK